MEKKNNKIMEPTFDEVTKLDNALQYLAAYEVNGGLLNICTSMEEMTELSFEIADKYNYFKKLIQSGECTFEFIKNSVLSKNGPYPQNDKNKITDLILDKEEKEDKKYSKNEKKDNMKQREESAKKFIESLFDQFAPDVKLEKIEFIPIKKETKENKKSSKPINNSNKTKKTKKDNKKKK